MRKNSQEHRASRFATLFSFDKTDGGWPSNSVLLNVHGTLYGTTSTGGVIKNSCRVSAGCGTVFSITPSGTEKTLFDFEGRRDGGTPYAGLIDVNGTFYGTTYVGGDKNCGTVFSITSAGEERLLHSFAGGADGCNPQAPLVNVHGILYGTAQFGGKGYACYGHSCGVVFSITTAGKEQVLYDFGPAPDGNQPVAGLLDVNGMLYGTTYTGGSGSGCNGYPCGTVFSVTTAGKEQVLHSFSWGTDNNGAYPYAGLIDVNGTLYGTTESGGATGAGTVFSMTTSGNVRVLYSFANSPDGASPVAGLTYTHGKLYGTTCVGGTSGNGTVFSVTLDGSERVRHSFSGDSRLGICPGGVTAIKDALYGTTYYGGANSWGSVYRLKL